MTSTAPATSTAGGRAEWRRALRRTDRELARLARTLRPGTLLLITADHGMVDVPHTERMDLAERPGLGAGVAVLGGEGRFAQAYCRAGRHRRGRRRGGGAAGRRGRRSGLGADPGRGDRPRGGSGRSTTGCRGRIGDVIVAGIGPFTLVDSRTAGRRCWR